MVDEFTESPKLRALLAARARSRRTPRRCYGYVVQPKTEDPAMAFRPCPNAPQEGKMYCKMHCEPKPNLEKDWCDCLAAVRKDDGTCCGNRKDIA